MTAPIPRQPIPESLGPGQDNVSGTVTYGVPSPAGRVSVTPPRSVEEREDDRRERARTARCDRCMALPDAVVESIAVALRAAKEGKLP